MITRIAIIAFLSFITLQVNADIIRVSQNHIEIEISHGDKPFSISGTDYSDSKKATSLLAYIYENWSLEDLPILIIHSRTKALMPGEEFLHKEIKRLSKELKFQVVYLPTPTSGVTASTFEILKKRKAWAEKHLKNETE